MKKAGTGEKFIERHPEIELTEYTLPDNWGDEDEATPAEKLRILADRTEKEREAVRVAQRYELNGIPYVAFLDEDGGVLSEDGAVNLTQLSDLYQEALEALTEDPK